MRIITHNMLKCNVRGVENGYPLIIESGSTTEVIECEFNKDVVLKMLQRVNLLALRSAAQNLNIACCLTRPSSSSSVADIKGAEQSAASLLEPLPAIELLMEEENSLKEIHHLLFELHVLEGALICPESGRKFPIKEGIPNMLLHEDEV